MNPLNPYASFADRDLLATLVGRDKADQMLSRAGGSLALVVREASRSYDPRGRLPPSLVGAAVELVKRSCLEEAREATFLTAPSSVREYLCLHLGHLEFELFMCLMLDAQNRLIAPVELFRGTLTQTSVYPREVVKQALASNAGGLILVRNNPSKVAEPSEADKLLTATLRTALALVDVRVLDHMIVAGSSVLSMAERGLIRTQRRRSTMFIYRDVRKTSGCLTVGHYAPDGEFIPESDHDDADKAADRCHYLNGGPNHSPDPLCQVLNEGDGTYRP